jgi:hypothetical protein
MLPSDTFPVIRSIPRLLISCWNRAESWSAVAGSILFLLPALSPQMASAQAISARSVFQLGTPARYQVKAENGWIVFWVPGTSDPTLDQIKLFNPSGEKILSVRPLLAVQGSRRSAVWDVSVGRSGLLAVAAKLIDSQGRWRAFLLLYNSVGELVRACPVREEIFKLEVDQDDSIWAIGMRGLPYVFANDQNPSNGTPLFRYDALGNILSEVTLQPQPLDVVELVQLGDLDASLGITGDRVWFYLPSSHELFTTLRDGGGLKVVNTGLPAPPVGGAFPDTVIQRASYLNNGTLLAQIIFFGNGHASSNLYAWNPGTNHWTVFREGEINWSRSYFLGVQGDRLAVLDGKPRSIALYRCCEEDIYSETPSRMQVVNWYPNPTAGF